MLIIKKLTWRLNLFRRLCRHAGHVGKICWAGYTALWNRCSGRGRPFSAVRAESNYLGVWPYQKPILWDTRGIIVP